MARSRTAEDRELAALGAILRALDGLDGESIQRVFDYVFNRLSISTPISRAVIGVPTGLSIEAAEQEPRTRRPSIRDLAEQKRPQSSNQMAALVAYYLSEVAEDTERKPTINTADISRYFKQAGFRLPRVPRSTLPNAAAPSNRVIVHNHVRPTRRLGSRGFRAWLACPDPDRLVRCACAWAPELGEHYRVRREDEQAERAQPRR